MSLAEHFQTWGLGFSQTTLRSEINEELEFHLHCRIQELTDSGIPLFEATHQANQEFGDQSEYAKACQQIRLATRRWLVRVAICGFVGCLVIIGWLWYSLYHTNLQNSSLTNQLMSSISALNSTFNDRDISGTVVDADGNPIVDAKVLLLHKTWRGGYSQAGYSTTTDENGKYVFEDQYRGDSQNAFLVSVLVEGYELQSHYQVYQSGDDVPERNFQLVEAPPKRFKFVGQSGNALANAEVFISSRQVDQESHMIYPNSRNHATWLTDENGEVEFAFFQTEDRVEFRVTDEDGQAITPVVVTIDAGDEDDIQTIEVDVKDKGVSIAPPAPAPTKNDESHVNWIRDNAVTFTSIDPAEDDFADLQKLKELIGDARIVQLGEQSHGDGTCFLTKTRMVKFLHQEMGFDVIAFESGLYDCRVAWDAFIKGEGTPTKKASQGVFGIWTGSAQTTPLWNYLAEKASTDNPLELAGFDCQFTGAGTRQLRDDLAILSDKLKIESLSDKEWEEFDRTLGRLISFESPTQSKRDFLSTISVLKHAVEQADEATLPVTEAKFWSQQLASLADHCGRQWEDERAENNVMARDAQMARNMIWLANELYPDRKIIVWAASFHIMRNPPDIESFNQRVDYSEMIQMGHLVHEELGEEVYTIGFTAYEGRAGAYHLSKRNIGEAPEGTLESLCHAADLQDALIPFRGTEDSAPWLHQFLYARPMGYSWMKARWPNHFDAMVFNQKMRPSTKR